VGSLPHFARDGGESPFLFVLCFESTHLGSNNSLIELFETVDAQQTLGTLHMIGHHKDLNAAFI
jgi:hypothetical protein